jgi:hypothetical protein
VLLPSTWNCTKATGLSGSEAVAVIVIVPETLALLAGAVTFTAGAVVSGITVKLTPLLAIPPTVATTLPVVAPLDTGTAMLVGFQFVGVPLVPLKVTVLVPCVEPKFVPVMVTAVPTTPELGFMPVMFGGGGLTVKVTPLLDIPLTVATTLPVVAPLGTVTAMLVAFQFVGVAVVPLKVTVLVP